MGIYIRVGNERQLKPKTAVVYIRTASAENALALSEKQLNLIKEYAALNNIEIKFVFKDLGVSGLNYYCQKGLYSSLDKVRKERIDYVLISEPSRISRNMNYYIAFEKELRRLGTKVVSVSNAKEAI